jgi:hypothetical protein
MNRQFAALALGWILVAGLVTSSPAVITETHRYDFEKSSGYVTQAGWTHMDPTIAYTATTPGFDLANSHFHSPPAEDRVTSTQSPTDVTRDLIVSFWAPTNTPTFVFRDIVPHGGQSVSFTIYRSDPGDGFGTYFNTFVSFDGGPLTLVPAALEGGFYHTPITGSLAFDHSAVATSTLDFYFFSTIENGDTNVRLNGIEAIFSIPEPSTACLLGIALAAILRRRERAASNE